MSKRSALDANTELMLASGLALVVAAVYATPALGAEPPATSSEAPPAAPASTGEAPTTSSAAPSAAPASTGEAPTTGSAAPSAAPAEPEPAPYGAWQGRGHAPPSSAVPPSAPLPKVGAPEYSRRPVELIPTLSVALPSCRAGTQSDDRCEGVSTGGTLAFTALWRVTPYFAWGGGFELAGFSYDPPRSFGRTHTSAGAVSMGLTGRVYFNDEGALDPYVQLGIGVGALGTTFNDKQQNGDPFEETGAGPAAQVGGGIDFYLGRSVRIGPTLMYTRVFVDKIRRCRGGGSECVDVNKDDDGHLDAFLTAGASITVMLGEEL
jgi:hypothetical protein